jgi:3D (Asp-Asp-Asp) domain-containing protein
MDKKRISILAALVAAVIIIGGVGHEAKGEGKGTTEPAIQTIKKGGSGDNGQLDGTSPGPTAGEEGSREVQEGMGSGETNSSGLQAGAAKAGSGSETVSRGTNDASQRTDGLTSLGTFKVTAYTAGYESTGKNPGEPLYGQVAISGSKWADFEPVYATEDVTAAADWDVLPPGSIVYIEGVGERVIQDKGGAVRGNHIDLYIPDLEDALEWGVQERDVYLIEKGDY